ncbi:MAG: type 4a pilus biogenesis protein PilO [Candidatus Omnitrophica bacterium]|nr:type 4a pilus biogenesis protein PilO [Candidatus Omnitrophota bacterium]
MNNSSLAELLSKNKFAAVNGAVVILALIISFNIFNAQNKGVAVLEERKNQEIQKNQILSEISLLEKKVNVYKKGINSKDISSVINKIGNIAKDSSVYLVSVRPEKSADYGQYTKYNFFVNVSSDNYHKLGDFVSRIENSPDIYFIDNLQISLVAASEAEPGKLNANFYISTILIKG